jgi:dipeptidyl aminopeptidase/acylaminoacyl peptidase
MPEPSRGLTPDDFYLLKTPSDPRVSPVGARVAYVLSWPDRDSDEMRSSIYVAPADGSSGARRFTYGNKDSSPRWSTDGRHLAFVSDRGEEAQLFVAPVDGGEGRKVTKAKFGVSEPAWSPDSRRIAYVAKTGDWKRPDERSPIEKNAPRVLRDLYYRFDGVGNFDERRAHIFVVDVQSGDETQITEGDWNDSNPSWSPDGRTIVFASDRSEDRFQRPMRADVWAVAASGGEARRLSRGLGFASLPRFSPDGRLVAYIGHEHGDRAFGENQHVLVVPAEGATEAPLSLTAPLDRSPGGGLAWTKDGDVLFTAVDRGRHSLYRSRPGSGSATTVLAGERQIQAFDIAEGSSRIAFVAAWVDQPAEVCAADVTGGPEVKLSDAGGDLLAAARPGEVERFAYSAADGMEIEAFAVYPPDYEAGQRRPMMLLIHGGPHGLHPAAFGIQAQVLAGAGYVVLMPNPRGSGGYGAAFLKQCIEDWGGADFQDLMTGVDEMVRRGIADPERLYVGGYSYGGFMTSWVVGHTDRFRAAYIGAPVVDLVGFFGQTDIPLFARLEIGGWPWEAPEAFRERSPLTHLTNCVTPVILMHREGDMRCPISQSEEVFQVLKVRGQEVEFVRYPGGSHGVATPSQTVDSFRRLIAWYDGHAPAATRVEATPEGAVAVSR